jgi:hypothetical protein
MCAYEEILNNETYWNELIDFVLCMYTGINVPYYNYILSFGNPKMEI